MSYYSIMYIYFKGYDSLRKSTLLMNNYCSMQVFVLDFVPRLTVDPELQEHMRQEFHRVAASMGTFPKNILKKLFELILLFCP